MREVIAAISTGPVLSAIGIVRLSGDGTLPIMDQVFRPADGRPMSAHPDRQLVYGTLLDENGRVLDLCLATISHGPGSYTGEDTGELQCHGSPVVLRQALSSLFARGARQAKAGEFTRRAFLNGRMDLTQAEAVIDLIDAETPQAARNAAGQLSGAIARRTDAVYRDLRDICAHYHAVLDYPDEDIPPFELRAYARTLEEGIASLSALLATFSRGRFLEKGVPTAIVGKPNVGKSSLLNALLGYERAIVTDIPGTTRDTLSERCSLGGVALRLTDTAGLRQSADAVEALGVERAVEALRDAGLVIAVFDTSRPWEAEDETVAAECAGVSARIAVCNKADLPPLWSPERLRDRFETVVSLSAATGEGLDALERAVAVLFPLPAVAAGEILTNERQAEAIAEALDYLAAARNAMTEGWPPDAVLTECEGAMEALGTLSGKTVRQDVTERIFSRCCVGK